MTLKRIGHKNRRQTIDWVVKAGLCISCGTCVSACESHSILWLTGNGRKRLKPVVGKDCRGCGRCLAVCPGKENQPPDKSRGQNLLHPFLQTFVSYSRDERLRYQATSGGLLSAISLYLLRNRLVESVITARMSEESPLSAKPFFASKKSHVLQAMGSKYCPVPLNLILRELDPDKRYAYIGLPCHLRGLAGFLDANPQYKKCIHYRLGLFCSRTPSSKATEFLLAYNRIPRESLNSLRYRADGHPGSLRLLLKDGTELGIPHLDFSNWGYAFLQYFMQYRCWLCDDKTATLSDISCGDDWTVAIQDDPLGRSNLIVRSPAGMELLRAMRDRGEIELLPLDPDKLVASQELKRKRNVAPRFRVAGIFGLPRPGNGPRGEGWDYRELFRAFRMLLRIKLSDLPYPVLKPIISFTYRFHHDD